VKPIQDHKADSRLTTADVGEFTNILVAIGVSNILAETSFIP
jgi:hypothetical protein